MKKRKPKRYHQKKFKRSVWSLLFLSLFEPQIAKQNQLNDMKRQIKRLNKTIDAQNQLNELQRQIESSDKIFNENAKDLWSDGYQPDKTVCKECLSIPVYACDLKEFIAKYCKQCNRLCDESCMVQYYLKQLKEK